MSYRTPQIYIVFVLALFLSACEDTQKATSEKDLPRSQVEVSKSEKSDKIDESKTPQIEEKITDKNVVEFLTQYGKENPETQARIETSYGQIEIELYTDTPLHRANFIYLVKNRYFDDTFFHRVVPNFIIQAGNSDLRSTNKKRFALGDDYLLPAEINERDHFYGSISGAKEYRENPDKKSAPYEFFIFLGPLSSTSHLNGNYTVFGKVTHGMDVVEKIAALPTDDGDWPLNNVYISIELI
ncbi:MAG: peptidylprolyl isomerase [Flavobacteriaceae bacterium]|nr:peptidylprolyl isomerase [Flavobacteriaceae bacterium]